MRPSFEVAQAIVEKKAKYCRFADTGKWESLAEVAAPDFKFEFVDNGVAPHAADMPQLTSLESFTQTFSKMLASKQTHHMVGQPELDQTSSDEVKAIFPIQYYVADKGATPKPGALATGAGHYHEIYRKVGDEWFLAESAVVHTLFVAGP